MWQALLIRVLPFLRSNWLPLAALLVIGGLYAYADHWKSTAQQRDDQIAALRADKAARESAILAERAQWNARVARLREQAGEDVAALSVAHTRALADSDAARADAVRGMRSALDALRRAGAASKPAAVAPAECREFQADARVLPERDQQLLIDLGAAADRAVLERNTAVDAYNALTRRFLEEGQH